MKEKEDFLALWRKVGKAHVSKAEGLNPFGFWLGVDGAKGTDKMEWIVLSEAVGLSIPSDTVIAFSKNGVYAVGTGEPLLINKGEDAGLPLKIADLEWEE